MSLQSKQLRLWHRLPLMLCALVVSGCAGLPRIDPTGERVLVWPQNQPVVATPGVGSVQAPPVFTDPVFPAPALQPGAVTTSVPGVVVSEDRMSITPERIMAPVGSEVILRAGICAKEGFLLTDQKVEWLVARESAGEIVALGGRGYCRNPVLPWNKPKKVDNQYGIGYTAKMPLLITRGTASPADDVQVEPGHAWASITSPSEGISRITAVTPTIVNWATRQATATIYWIDAQWEFPTASISAGGSQVLTTTLLRQTDRTPLQGWIVRYEVASGAGNLAGGQSGQVVEVVTGVDGRASIDVTPTGSEGSVTQINMQLVRPAGLDGTAYPRLVVANGSTTIDWTGQSTPYLPELDQPVGDSSTFDQPRWGAPPASQPIGPQLPGRFDSQPTSPTAPRTSGRPALDVQVYNDNPGQKVEVGGQAQFRVVIRNNGNAAATKVMLRDKFPNGLQPTIPLPPSRDLETDQVGTLAPGQSRTVNLTFNVTQPGYLCHTVNVTCDEFSATETATADGCVTAIQPEPRGRADLKVNHDGPVMANQGDTALFKIVLRNDGDVPLTNLLVVGDYKDPLQPVPQPGKYEIVNGSVRWQINRLEVGDTETLEVPCNCLRPFAEACALVTVTDDSGLMRVDDHCVEIAPRGGGTGVVPGGGAAQDGTLRLAISPYNDTVRALTRIRIPFYIENSASTPEQQVQLRIQFPPELDPDLSELTNRAGLRASRDANNIVTFDKLAELRPQERIEFQIPIDVKNSGTVDIIAELRSQAVTNPVVKTQRITIINRP